MKTLILDEIVCKAVLASLSIIDDATEGLSNFSTGECGDKLASELDKLIRKSLTEFVASDNAPAFIKYI